MTTNQTIDGVPRELLESFAAYVADSPNAIMRSRAALLRALLDVSLTDEGEKPAVQPQGEPEAWTTSKPKAPGAYWIRGFNLSGEFTESALVQVALEGDEQVLMVNLHQSTTEKDTAYWYEVGDINSNFEWLGPLYAEQPAPVAVVLPERREPTQDNPYLNDADHDWNACVDEVTRLNAESR